MAEAPTQSKRTSGRKRPAQVEAPEPETTEAEGAEAATAEEATTDDVDAAVGTDGDVVPSPPAPTDPEAAGPADAGEQVESEAGVLSHQTLLANLQIFGDYPPEAVRGVLAGAPDPISVEELRNRLDAFLGSPVVPIDQTEEA